MRLRKIIAVLAVLAVAQVASAEVIWALTDTYKIIDSKVEICSFDAYTGTFVQAPRSISAMMGNMKVAYSLGLAVAGNTAYISYADPSYVNTNPNVGNWLLVVDLTTMTKIADLPLAKHIRGLTMSLDGTTLYGGSDVDNYIYAIDKTTGALTQKALIPGDYKEYWSALPGTNPVTNIDWVTYSYTNEATGDMDTSLAFWANYKGGQGDQVGAQCWRSDGLMLHTYYNNFMIQERTATHLYDAGTYVTNWWPAPLYNIATVNGYTFQGTGIYGLSPVFGPVPEPATMGLLLAGGVALLRRRRTA